MNESNNGDRILFKNSWKDTGALDSPNVIISNLYSLSLVRKIIFYLSLRVRQNRL